MAEFALNPIPAAPQSLVRRLRGLMNDLVRAYIAARQSRVTYGAL